MFTLESLASPWLQGLPYISSLRAFEGISRIGLSIAMYSHSSVIRTLALSASESSKIFFVGTRNRGIPSTETLVLSVYPCVVGHGFPCWGGPLYDILVKTAQRAQMLETMASFSPTQEKKKEDVHFGPVRSTSCLFRMSGVFLTGD